MKKFSLIGLIFFLLISSSVYSQKAKKPATKPNKQKQIQVDNKKATRIQSEMSVGDIFENRVRIIYNQPDTTHKAFVISTTDEKIEIDTAGGVIAAPNQISLYAGTQITDNATLLFKTFYGTFEFVINALSPRTHYYIQVYNLRKGKYEFIQQKEFTTLAPEPKIQANGIVFKEVTESSIALTWVNGNGEGRIVVARKDQEPNLPEDGAIYPVVKDIINEKPNLKDSWVVYDSKSRDNELKFDHLQAGTYYFQIFEYNGDSIQRNYNVLSGKSGNPRAKTTSMQTPKLSPARDITKWGFTLDWTSVVGSSSYMLDIATDMDFKNKLSNYDSIDLGLIQSFKIMDLEPDRVYFARIRAISKTGESVYSNVIEVRTSK